MSDNKNTVPVIGTEGKMRECVDNEENFAGGKDRIKCNKATTMTTTVIPTQTTMNKVFDTHKQTSTSGEVSERNTNTPTSKHPATTSTTCGGISEQHSSYLKYNLDMVREKCREFHACTVELYKSENLPRILAGDNIQLRNICGLLYQNTNGSYRILDNQCSTQERESIKELLGEELSPVLEGSIPREGSWGKLKTCLDNTPGDSTYLQKLCRLKGNSALPPLCNSTDVQTTTETFFNDKLRQHHCICNTFTDSSASSSATSFPLGPLIGGVIGGGLMLLLIFIIFFLCVRLRKLRETANRWTHVWTQESDGLHLIFTKASPLEVQPRCQKLKDEENYFFQSLKSEDQQQKH